MADGPITLTLKGGGGYDAPWLVVSGASVSEIGSKLYAYSSELGRSFDSAIHAITEANALADVKATLGATEEKRTPPVGNTDPAKTAPATPGQLVVLKKKFKKTDAELEGLTQAEAAQMIQEGSR